MPAARKTKGSPKRSAGNVSDVQSKSAVPVAMVVSDMHFSDKAPLARSGEPDWFETQKGYVKQLGEALEKLDASGQAFCPLIIAGDIFDKSNCSVRLANAVSDWFYLYLKKFRTDEGGRHVLAIPGQHDLPNHVYKQRFDSGYGTLLNAGVITDMETHATFVHPNVNNSGTILEVTGFPWQKYEKAERKFSVKSIHVAAVHAYVWSNTANTYDSQQMNSHVKNWQEHFDGFDFAVFGDNHIPFFDIRKTKPTHPTVFNCGGFMRRTTAEREHRPGYGVIYSDKMIRRFHLNTSKDEFIEADDTPTTKDGSPDPKFDKFMEKMKDMADGALSVKRLIKEMLDQFTLSPKCRAYVETVVEEESDNG